MNPSEQLKQLMQGRTDWLASLANNVLHGDCVERLRECPDNMFTACVTDPPYELGFMGKSWDNAGVAFDPKTWAEILRVTKPGGMLLAFGGTRTYHRLICAIEDAGWKIRDCIMWVFATGFPKSHNISKALDAAAGAEREVVGFSKGRSGTIHGGGQSVGVDDSITALATDLAKTWDGFGTGLKPSWEPICLAMKPLDGTFAQNAAKHGVAGLNIDKSRVAANGENPSEVRRAAARKSRKAGGDLHSALNARLGIAAFNKDISGYCEERSGETLGRWPANLIHDGSDQVLAGFPQSNGQQGGVSGKEPSATSRNVYCLGLNRQASIPLRNDSGSAARFFYQAKASAAERNAGLEGLSEGRVEGMNHNPREHGELRAGIQAQNHHPTVKPLALMRYLVGLVTMPEQTYILDPFCGSGSTLKACQDLGVDWCGIDSNLEYVEIARKRVLA